MSNTSITTVLRLLMIMLLISSCNSKNTKEITDKFPNQLGQDDFSYRGTYAWAFDLMNTEQVSTHTFFEDSISYTMTGKVYSTDYTIKKLSYQKDKNKWIGEDEDGIVYVLFFKEKTDSTLTLYKHKCKSGGLEEAINFEVPKPDTTEDHGWNVYTTNEDTTKDILSISGEYANIKHSLLISDPQITIDDKAVEKVSFHLGERRWVGKHNNQYLQVFFKNLGGTDSIQIASTWSNDLKMLYKTKYNSVINWETYSKQKK